MASKKNKAIPLKDETVAPRWSRRTLLSAVIAASLVGGGVWGLWRMRTAVEQRVAVTEKPPTIVMKNRPAWMSDTLAQRIAVLAQPRLAKSAFDDSVVRAAYENLKASPWVRNVRSVRRVYDASAGPGALLEIDCDFRTPAALVYGGPDAWWLVDTDGVKLPERFSEAQLPLVMYVGGKTNLRLIQGVVAPVPEAGKAWAGDDLRAGLRMAAVLADQPFTNDINRIDVSNFAGRMKRQNAEIVLGTRYRTQIYWGHLENDVNYFRELLTAQKLQTLARYYERSGRADAGHAWVDVRFESRDVSPELAVPRSQSASAVME